MGGYNTPDTMVDKERKSRSWNKQCFRHRDHNTYLQASARKHTAKALTWSDTWREAPKPPRT